MVAGRSGVAADGDQAAAVRGLLVDEGNVARIVGLLQEQRAEIDDAAEALKQSRENAAEVEEQPERGDARIACTRGRRGGRGRSKSSKRIGGRSNQRGGRGGARAAATNASRCTRQTCRTDGTSSNSVSDGDNHEHADGGADPAGDDIDDYAASGNGRRTNTCARPCVDLAPSVCGSKALEPNLPTICCRY